MYEHRKRFIWLHYRDVHSAFHQNVDHNLYYIGNTTAGPFLTHRQKINGENVNVWNGRDIFTLLAKNQ
jgi:hypothetical protein